MGAFEANCNTIPIEKLSIIGEDEAFWCMDEPIIVGGKIVRGGMFAPQRTWWELPNFVKMFVSGYGGGKTFTLGKRAIALALENAPCPIATVSPTFPQARQTVIPTIMELLEGKRGLYGKSFRWTYHKAFHEFRIRFHGREALIYCNSGENPQSLRGPNLAAAYIDEPFIQAREVFTQMVARVRHPDAKFREIGLFGTPESINWGFDLAMGEDKDFSDVGMVQSSTRQNKALEAGYVERLLGALDERAAKAYVDGQFVNLASGQVYYAFDATRHIGEYEKPEHAEYGVGLDFNVNPMACVVFWHDGERMHVVKEYEFANADTEYVAQALREDWGEELQDAYPDASGSARKTAAPEGKSDFWYLQNAGFNIQAPHANPKRKDRYNAVNGKLKPAARNAAPLLTISKKCPKLRKYLSIYSHERMNKPEEKKYSHLLDAFSYPVSFLYGVDKDTLDAMRVSGS